jgi:uncharacterized coiled-coil protein SlyX
MSGAAIEAVRAWMSTGFLAAITLLIARIGKPVAEYLIETHRLRAQEKKDDRQGYGDLIEALSKEVHELRAETSRQRAEIRTLHDMIDSFTRGNLQARRSAQVVELNALPSGDVPPATAAALERMKGTGE